MPIHLLIHQLIHQLIHVLVHMLIHMLTYATLAFQVSSYNPLHSRLAPPRSPQPPTRELVPGLVLTTGRHGADQLGRLLETEATHWRESMLLPARGVARARQSGSIHMVIIIGVYCHTFISQM